jgi:hypothetical protein
MTESGLDGLLKIFEFEKKGDVKKYCGGLVISSKDFFALVLACEHSGIPFSHEITYRGKVPGHLVPSDSEIEALKNTPAGSLLSGDADKAVRKMSQMFEERRYLVGHMFFVPDLSRWHFFCFDQRDLETEGNHWKKGSHVHFVNWLWPGQDAKAIWSDYVTEDIRPGGALHLRFSE